MLLEGIVVKENSIELVSGLYLLDDCEIFDNKMNLDKAFYIELDSLKGYAYCKDGHTLPMKKDATCLIDTTKKGNIKFYGCQKDACCIVSFNDLGECQDYIANSDYANGFVTIDEKVEYVLDCECLMVKEFYIAIAS